MEQKLTTIVFNQSKGKSLYKLKNKRLYIEMENPDIDKIDLIVVELAKIEDKKARAKVLSEPHGLRHSVEGRLHSKYIVIYTYLEINSLMATVIIDGLNTQLEYNEWKPKVQRNLKNHK